MFGGVRFGLMGTPMDPSYGQGPAAASFDQMNGVGMDAMGSLKKHSDFATQFARNPSGGMGGGFFGFGGAGAGPMNYGGG